MPCLLAPALAAGILPQCGLCDRCTPRHSCRSLAAAVTHAGFPADPRRLQDDPRGSIANQRQNIPFSSIGPACWLHAAGFRCGHAFDGPCGQLSFGAAPEHPCLLSIFLRCFFLIFGSCDENLMVKLPCPYSNSATISFCFCAGFMIPSNNVIRKLLAIGTRVTMSKLLSDVGCRVNQILVTLVRRCENHVKW